MSPRPRPRSSLSNRPTAISHRPRTRLAVELLEARDVPSAVAPPSGLVSWWTADDTAADLEGLNNATLSNVTYAAGEVGQAFSFNGQNGWAALGDPPSLAFTSSFTIEGWVKVNALDSSSNFESIMFRGDDRGGLDPYQLSVRPNGDLQFGIVGTNVGASIEAPVPLGQFVHLAATLDDATGLMTLYENGAVVAQTTTTARPFGPLDPTQQPGVGIGNSNALSNYDIPFNGLIDELAVYNRALTPGEVMGVYSAGSAGKIKTSTYIAPACPGVAEGPAGSTTPVTFTVNRVGNTSGQAVVNWTTADGTATAGSDYAAASGQVVFQDGESQKTVMITVDGDDVGEANETVQLLLSTTAPGYAVGTGWATIVNDDVGVAITDGSATEGDTRIGRSLGAFVSQSDNGGMSRSSGLAWGPDGNLYVGSLNTDQVLRFDGTTGAFLGTFIDGVDSPAVQGLVFRPDGLYVLSRDAAEVQRFDPTTGALLGVFIPPGTGGLAAAAGMTVGPDGDWYISSGTNEVLRYSAAGAFLGAFVSAGSGGLSTPRGLTFGPDGNLYVTSQGTNSVLRFNGQTGAFMNTFVAAGSDGPRGLGELRFSDGSLYVSSPGMGEVLRYDAQSGAYLDVAATAGFGGLASPIGLLLDSNNNLLVGSNYEILRYGPRSLAAFTVHLSIPSATPVTVDYATASGTATSGSDFTPVSGTLTFAPGQTTQTIVVPTLSDSVTEGTETLTVSLSNPVGATITDGTGVGTIADGNTKFYVVADGSGTDLTYRYGTAGNPLATSALGTGDTSPRGVTTTAAGDKLWVVDANENVYVYTNLGMLLGSWAAKLPAMTQPTGIATNGTDIWLVERASDKVYRYAGAASRLSGSQSAASSFNLVTGKKGATNPQDIVTDGTYFWVVADGTSTDQVFKYTLTGSLLGSWTIDPADRQPAGIAINPANPSDIWIVDSGTKTVYQYTAAAGRTSGSQTAAATFAVASGDTFPVGIADPPPASAAEPVAEPAAAAPTVPVADIPGSLVAAGFPGLAPLTPPTPGPDGVTAGPSPSPSYWIAPDEYDFAPIDVSTGGNHRRV